MESTCSRTRNVTTTVWAVLGSLLLAALFCALLVPSALAASDGNDTLKTAETIAVNEYTTTAITDYYDKDYYKFTIDEPGVIDLYIEHEIAQQGGYEWQYAFYTESTSELLNGSVQCNTSSYQSSLVGIPAGTYYLLIRNADNNMNLTGIDIDFTVDYVPWDFCEQEPVDDNLSTPTPLVLGQDYIGSIWQYYDVDYYAFTLDKPGVISIDFNHSVLDSSKSEWQVALFDGNGSTTIHSYDVPGIPAYTTSPKIGLDSGTYYLRVKNADNNMFLHGTDYGLRVDYTQSNVWERELDDGYASATAISPNATYAGTSKSGYDNDYYTFTLKEPKVVYLVFSHPLQDSQSNMWNYRIEDASGNPVWTDVGNFGDSISGMPEQYQSEKHTLDAGTYYLVVTPSDMLDWSADTYKLTVKQEAVWTRLGGDNRYDTMDQIVPRGFDGEGNCKAILVASGANYADALTASALVGAWNVPLITTTPSSLDSNAREQIQRLAGSDTTVYILGGTAAVSSNVSRQIGKIDGVSSVKRIAGKDRIGTGTAIYNAAKDKWGDTCIVTNAWNYADALAISAYAASNNAPIFGTTNGKLTSAQVKAIKAGGFSKVVVLGGPNAVNYTSVTKALSGKKFVRLAGEDRIGTSEQIVLWETGHNSSAAFQPVNKLTLDNMCMATAWDFADALASVNITSQKGSALLLVDASSVSYYAINNIIGAYSSTINQGFILGGTSAVSNIVMGWCRDAS